MLQVVKVRGGQIVKTYPFNGSVYQAVSSIVGAMKKNEDHQELVLNNGGGDEVLRVVRREDGELRVDIMASKLLRIRKALHHLVPSK